MWKIQTLNYFEFASKLALLEKSNPIKFYKQRKWKFFFLIYRFHMKTFYDEATVFYEGGSHNFHINRAHAPGLFFLSKTDPVGTVKISKSVHDSWVNMGIKVK